MGIPSPAEIFSHQTLTSFIIEFGDGQLWGKKSIFILLQYVVCTRLSCILFAIYFITLNPDQSIRKQIAVYENLIPPVYAVVNIWTNPISISDKFGVQPSFVTVLGLYDHARKLFLQQ